MFSKLIASLTDRAKLATLASNRAANTRLLKILYWMSAAQEKGCDLGAVVDEALISYADAPEARERLAHLKIAKDATPAAVEKWKRGGSRIAWRFAETEYLWIVAWADSEGKIERISGSVRPEKKKPFKEIGDLSRAKVHNESMAMWIVERSDGSSYRLVAKGPAEQAVTIYMYSLKNLPSD